MIIGIHGKARRGKDYLARAMSERMPVTAVLHWSNSLYAEVREPHDILLNHNTNRSYAIIDGMRLEHVPLLRALASWFPYACKTQDDRKGTFYLASDMTTQPDGAKDGSSVLHIYLSHVMVRKDPLMLQWWGTEYRRDTFGVDYWVKQLARRVAIIEKNRSQSIIVIPDTRFANEAQWIKDHGGILVHIEADRPFEDTGRDDSHPSETELDDYWDWDCVVKNNYDDAFIHTAMTAIRKLL